MTVPDSDGASDADYEQLLGAVRNQVFVVDVANRLTLVSQPLSERTAVADDSRSPPHVSAILATPEGDVEAEINRVRAHLRADGGSAVRSTAFQLRTSAGRRKITIDFSLLPSPAPASIPTGVADSTAAAGRVDDRSPTADESESATIGDPATPLVGIVCEEVVESTSTDAPTGSEPDRFRQLFEQLPDPVTEVSFRDDRSIVESVNPAFEAVFGYDRAEIVGRPLNEFIVPQRSDPAVSSVASDLDRKAAHGGWTSAEVVREGKDGSRTFLFRSIPFTHDGEQRGFGVYTDVTDRENQQRYHAVLNRLLRHNLRNDLNVIIGLADQLTHSLDDADPAVTAAGEQLKQRALELAETSRRARQLESVIGRSEASGEVVDIGAFVTDAYETLRETYPAARISLSVDEPAIGVAGPYLREAVTELAENAIEHAATDTPTIRISVEPCAETDSVDVIVADDGPGIPPEERAVVTGRRAITQLDHGSGLGLWVATWVVEAYGGDISFEGPDPELGGAAVRLRLRRAASG